MSCVKLTRLRTCVVSILVLIECFKLDINTTEMPLDMARMLIWSAVEVNMAIVASKLNFNLISDAITDLCLGSLLLLRPIFRRLVPGSFLSSSNPSDHPVSQQPKMARPIKLKTFKSPMTVEESSSIHHLAGSDDGTHNSSMDTRRNEPMTHISSPWAKDTPSEEWDYGDGIHVRSEMAVHVEHV